MFKKHQKTLQITLAAAYTALCIMFVSIFVLYAPADKPADTKQNNVEYTPPTRQTDYILLCCKDCQSRNALWLDYGQESATLCALSEGDSYNYTAKITFDEKLVCALADGAGGINFTLREDTEFLSAGNWRLTGTQVWQLLHSADSVIYEQLVSELFYTAFMFGLQKEQIYIILEYGICDGLSYMQLYNISRYSKDWLSQLSVVG